jgi:hypothetical protein
VVVIPVLEETTDTCAVCGEVGCEWDLLYVEYDDEVDGCVAGDVVCTDCCPDEASE